jgi:hypothetical protein
MVRHFHSDHYGGLSKSFDHGTIYCSEVTKKLVVDQLRVSLDRIIALPLNEALMVENVEVTLIDANQYVSAFQYLSVVS